MSGLSAARSNLNRLRRALGAGGSVSTNSGPSAPTNANGRATGSGGFNAGPRTISQVNPATISLIGQVLLEALDGALACINGSKSGAGAEIRRVLGEDGYNVVVIGGSITFTQPLDVAAAKRLCFINSTITYSGAGSLFQLSASRGLELCLVNSTVSLPAQSGSRALASLPVDTAYFELNQDDRSSVTVESSDSVAGLVQTTSSPLPGEETANVKVNGGSLTVVGTPGAFVFNPLLGGTTAYDFRADMVSDLETTGVLEAQARLIHNCAFNATFAAGQLTHFRATVECQNTTFTITGDRDASTPTTAVDPRPFIKLDTEAEGTHSEVEIVATFNNLVAATPGRPFVVIDPNGNPAVGKVSGVRIAQIDQGSARANNDPINVVAQRVEHLAVDTAAGATVSPTTLTISSEYAATLDLVLSAELTITVANLLSVNMDDSAVAVGLSHSISFETLGSFYGIGDGANVSEVTFASLTTGAGEVAWQANQIVCDTGIAPILTGEADQASLLGHLAVASAGGNIDSFVDATPQVLFIGTLVSLTPGTANILDTTAGAGASALSSIGTVINSADFADVIAAISGARIGASIA